MCVLSIKVSMRKKSGNLLNDSRTLFRLSFKLVAITEIISVSQKFCNILVTWGIIQQLRMLFLRLWRRQTILDKRWRARLILSECYTLAFFSVAQSAALKSTVLGVPDLSYSLRFLQREQIFWKYCVTALQSTVTSTIVQQMFFGGGFCGFMPPFKLVKHKFSILAT